MTTRPIRGIRGERVFLRPLEPEDTELVHRWYEDARLRAFTGELPRSMASRARRYEEFVRNAGSDHYPFVICRVHDEQPVGRADLFEIDLANGSAQLGIAIGDPGLWGQGLGTDAVNALVDFAFGQLRLERVWLQTDAHNPRAQASYAKAGFVQEGVARRAFYQDGAWLDAIHLALLRDEWAALTRPKSWDLVAGASPADSASP